MMSGLFMYDKNFNLIKRIDDVNQNDLEILSSTIDELSNIYTIDNHSDKIE
jgi:hypothetical protein